MFGCDHPVRARRHDIQPALIVLWFLLQPVPAKAQLVEHADRIEAVTARYVLVVKKQPLRFEVVRDGRIVLAAPDAGGGFYFAEGEAVAFQTLSRFSRKGSELELQASTAQANVSVTYHLTLAPEEIRVRAEVQGEPNVERVGERFTLAAGGHWYGGPVDQAHLWPLEAHEWSADPFLATSNHATPFWMTSSGVGIFLDTYDDVAASINRGRDGLFRFAYLRAPAMHYTIFVGRNIAEARDLFAAAVGKPKKRPPDFVFERPVWGTWCQYFGKVRQSDVLDYVRHIHDGGWPASVVIIDDGWQTHYGDNQFNSKFPDPRAMVDEVHRLGYRLALWVENFANPDSDRYRQGEGKGGLIRDAASGKPALIRWWNGEAALIDFGEDRVRARYVDELRALRRHYGVDGFKFDGGDAEYWPVAGAPRGPALYLTRNRYTDLWAEVGGEFELNELRVGWLSQPQGLFNRLRDKSASWSEKDGLPAIVTHGGIQSLLGFVFNCPDLIGGGLDEGFKPEEELNVRWAQAAAFMPVMQFSYGPWQFSETAQRTIRNFAELHGKLWRSHLKPLAERAMQTGKPIWSPLFYVFPEDEKAYRIRDQFMLGEDLLVAPVLHSGARERDVYLPAGMWRDFWSGKMVPGGGTLAAVPAPLESIPVFERIRRRAAHRAKQEASGLLLLRRQGAHGLQP
jgi:alpha-glucosidase (family GH31 glycosyl hydrolase)